MKGCTVPGNLHFEFMDNTLFGEYSEKLFSILHSNMSKIIPNENSREEEYIEWYTAVGGGMKKPNRRIVLIYAGDEIAGFFQYYTNADTFMMEEIQLLPEYRKLGIFRSLYDFLLPCIPDDISIVKAFAHKANTDSDGILKHMGLSPAGEDNGFTAYSGKYEDLIKWHKKEK